MCTKKPIVFLAPRQFVIATNRNPFRRSLHSRSQPDNFVNCEHKMVGTFARDCRLVLCVLPTLVLSGRRELPKHRYIILVAMSSRTVQAFLRPVFVPPYFGSRSEFRLPILNGLSKRFPLKLICPLFMRRGAQETLVTACSWLS